MIQDSLAAPEKLRPVFQTLMEALLYSSDAQSNEWDFAVPISLLKSLGANENDLRWLSLKKFVSHAREVTLEGDDGREFRPTGNLTFCEQSCFVLTETGVATYQGQTLKSIEPIGKPSPNRFVQPRALAMPSWDLVSRRLQFGARIVKRFRWPAANQMAVLCAFQEEGWPERIDDPLIPQPEQDSKRRLADTIKSLNRKQINELICFHGDGTGEGVLWERTHNASVSGGK